jgi:hypothetical protein
MTSEEKRHPEEPAEGGGEEVKSRGADKPDKREKSGEEGTSEHPAKPAEGGEEEVEASGADKPDER